jgi:hypothetical protein
VAVGRIGLVAGECGQEFSQVRIKRKSFSKEGKGWDRKGSVSFEIVICNEAIV